MYDVIYRARAAVHTVARGSHDHVVNKDGGERPTPDNGMSLRKFNSCRGEMNRASLSLHRNQKITLESTALATNVLV